MDCTDCSIVRLARTGADVDQYFAIPFSVDVEHQLNDQPLFQAQCSLFSRSKLATVCTGVFTGPRRLLPL